MANPTSKLNLVINGVTTQLDIHDANAVDLTSNQTVGGIKTFSNAPVVNSISLDGKIIDTDANDNMTYDGHIVDTIEEQGNGYIRYSNGLQICWGEYVKTTETNSTINFPKAFIFGRPLSVSVSGQSPNVVAGGWGSRYVYIVNTNLGAFTYTAIGQWK